MNSLLVIISNAMRELKCVVDELVIVDDVVVVRSAGKELVVSVVDLLNYDTAKLLGVLSSVFVAS